ncbi:MAG: protein DA1 [Candidatus Marinimicrobia bacterium]|nr:protein DA1 [Candidatus Neomarinimicrobiota bacterium]
MFGSRLKLSLLIFLSVFSILGAQSKCSYCSKPITGTYLTSDGKAYHEDCYRDHIQPRCDYCKKPIDGPYNLLDGKKYHSSCYRDHILAKCDICDTPIEGIYVTDFWNNSFHKYHTEDLHECFTCGRLICQNLTFGGYILEDGRNLCGICNETAVTDDFLLEASLTYVTRLLNYNGIYGIPKDIPVTLVDANTLKRLAHSQSDAMHGFTDQNIQTLSGKVISKKSHIYILSHLPLLMFRAVLAHELLHVYLFESNLDLKPDMREGFCNLGSEMVYLNDNSEYARFRLTNMKASKDPDYGIGYQKMSKLLEKWGWTYLLGTLDKFQ